MSLTRLLPRDPGERAFWGFALHLGTVWALALSNLFLVLAALAALPLARGGWERWRPFRAALLPLGLYSLFILASVAGSPDPRTSLDGARGLLSLVTLPLAFVVLDGEKRIRRLVDALVALGALVALHGLAQLLFGLGGLYNRIHGPFSHWMTFAGVLIPCLLLAAARLARGSGEGRAWRAAALTIMTVALVVNLTRSAWIGLLLAALTLLMMRAPRHLAALPSVSLVLLLLLPVPVVARAGSIFNLRDESNYDRLCMAEAGLLMVGERPLLGIGPSMVRARYPIYRHPTAPSQWVPHLHNTFLQIGAESGLPALAAYLWLMGAGALLALRRFRAEGGWRGPRADLYAGVLIVLLAFNVAGLFEDNWGDTEVQRVVLFVLAVPFCLAATGDRGGARDGLEPAG